MDRSFSYLIETEELLEGLDCPGRILLDATFTLPAQNRAPLAEYEATHLPGARFFDIDRIADLDSHLPHMLPDAAQFARDVSALGIDSSNEIIVYDNNHFMASARVWWMFRTFGHERIRVLNGGLQRWVEAGLPVTSERTEIQPQTFTPHFRSEGVIDFTGMKDISIDGSALILDARPTARFLGQASEPRPGLRSGHIPGSRNLFFQKLIDPVSQTLLPKDRLLEAFESVGVHPGDPVVTTCGSGVTAAILALGLAELGHPDTPIYDGSWAEWGQPGSHPVESESSATTHRE